MKIYNRYVNQFLLFWIMLSVSIIYFFESSIVAYFPLILSFFIFFIFNDNKFLTKHWYALILALSLSSYTLLIFSFNPYENNFISGYSVSLLMFLISIYSIINFMENSDDNYFSQIVEKNLNFFIITQFLICLGQLTNYYFGFGFSVKKIYFENSMITGSFNNSNDLASVLVLISYILLNLKKSINNKSWFLLLLLIMIILLGSRSALLLVVIILIMSNKDGFLKKIPILILFGFLIYISLILSESLGSENVLGRVSKRITSIFSMIDNGLSSDGSMQLRYDSYKNFFYVFEDVGWGSGEVRNYYVFGKDANFDTSLILSNPHSLIIELTYWSGYIGLFLFLLIIGYLFLVFNPSFFYLLLIFFTSMISSGALWSPIYIYIMILGFFIKKSKVRYFE